VAARFVLRQATAVFTDELLPDLKPPKPKTEPPPPDYLLPAAAATTVALRQISRQGDALASRCALLLKRRLKNYDFTLPSSVNYASK
jgi:hypothetical protein